MINQCLAICNNYFCTNQYSKSIRILEQVQKIDPNNEICNELFGAIARSSLGEKDDYDRSDFFGKNWQGESLDSKKIVIFCDQGIGDTIQFLRYLPELKRRWNCEIILNCYAFFEEFQELLSDFDSIDQFVNSYTPCDYHTNILSLPSRILDLKLEYHYPTNFEEINENDIPSVPYFNIKESLSLTGGLKVGIVWSSNNKSDLNKKKSFDGNLLEELASDNFKLYSLTPTDQDFPFIEKYLGKNLRDTAILINSMDLVVSVDTAILHLSGALGKQTWGLLCSDADWRWGKEGNKTVWYSSVKLYRQSQKDDWSSLINLVKEDIENFSSSTYNNV